MENKDYEEMTLEQAEREESLRQAEKLIRKLKSLPEDKEEYVLIMLSAYMAGCEIREAIEKDKEH